MAFLVFKEQRRIWTQVRALKLGNTISTYVQQQIERSGFRDVLPWGASGRQLLAIEHADFRDATHRLVIDLKPAAETNLSLYEIQHIWGWTTPAWTPIALRLRPLFADARVEHA